MQNTQPEQWMEMDPLTGILRDTTSTYNQLTGNKRPRSSSMDSQIGDGKKSLFQTAKKMPYRRNVRKNYKGKRGYKRPTFKQQLVRSLPTRFEHTTSVESSSSSVGSALVLNFGRSHRAIIPIREPPNAVHIRSIGINAVLHNNSGSDSALVRELVLWVSAGRYQDTSSLLSGLFEGSTDTGEPVLRLIWLIKLTEKG